MEDLDFELLLLVVVVEDLNRLPHVLLVVEHRREAVGLVGTSLAVVDPLVDGLVFFPSVVASEGLYSWQVGVVEDLILPFKDLKRLLSCLVLVDVCLQLINEGFLANDGFVFFNHICVPGRQALF